MTTVDMVNHPPHYADLPRGVGRECIEYTRHMYFSQGNAFKYVYRLGRKLNNQEDADKTLFYLNDALQKDIFRVYDHADITAETVRSRLLDMIAKGNLQGAAVHIAAISAADAFDRLDQEEL